MTGTEKLVACHRSKVSAQRQVAALFANQVKEQDMQDVDEKAVQLDGVEKCCGGESCEPQYVPSGVTSFAELDKVLDAEEAVCDMKTAAEQFKSLVNNIIWSDDVEDKAGAITKLSNEFAARIKGETTNVNDRYRVVQALSSKDGETDDKATWTRKFVNDLPNGSFLFIESGGEKNGEGKTVPRSLRHFPYKDASGKVDLPHLRNAIGRIPQSNAKGLTAAKKRKLQEKARGILAREQEKEVTLLDRITEAVKGWLAEARGEDVGPAEKAELGDKAGLRVWKQADGRYRWLAVFSNKYRDDDRPPEILSEAAHKEFAKAVKDGDWPYPELRHWHVPGTRWGMSDWIEYDDSIGFIMASGLVDEGHQVEAKAVASLGKGLGVSHGMPREEIERDAEDDTIITRYRTAEISDLPGWAAANPLTGFNIFGQQEVKTMRDDIKEHLQAAGMTDERIAELETELEGTAKQATEEREFKEADPEPDVQRAEGDEPTPEGDAEKDAEAPVLTKDEIAEAIMAAVEPATAKAMEPLVETLEALGKRLEDLERPDKVKVAEAAEATPAASLADLIHARTVGSKEARVDGRTSLAKDGPDETEPVAELPNVSGISFIDTMLAAQPEEVQ